MSKQQFPEPTVGALIFGPQGKLFLLSSHKWRDLYVIPGGHIELGESIEGALKREVKEETNLDVELTTPLLPFDRIVKLDGETSLHVIYVDYVARLLSGELEVGGDVGEALWVEKESISKMWQELHEDTQRLLKIAGIT